MAQRLAIWQFCGQVLPAQIVISKDLNLFLPVMIEHMETVLARVRGQIWLAAEIQVIKGASINAIERDRLTIR